MAAKTSSSPFQCSVWSLERYARMTSQITKAGSGNSEWEYFENTPERLEMTLTSTDQLLVHLGKRQLESLSLTGAASWMKGVSKGDSLMVICKIKDHSRRFRIKFSSAGSTTAEVKCRECVDRLAQYFPVKLPVPFGEESSQQLIGSPDGTPTEVSTLLDDVTLAQIAKAFTKSTNAQLPSIYADVAADTGIDLNTAIKLCLSDVNFPAFVGQVEQELNRIIQE